LGETQVTDDGLRHLSALTGLTKLWLHDTEVSDEGLKSLGELKQLRQLMIYNTKVTAKGFEYLHATLPDCLILYHVGD
jgi:hypothetical protein